VVSVPEHLLEIMACPECRASLEEREAALVCVGCGLHFPVKDGIPFMRPEDAYRPQGGDSS